MFRIRKMALALPILGIALVLASTAVAAKAPRAPKAPAPQLAGTWLTTVTLNTPPPGVDPTFQALDTFVPDGAVIVSSSQAHPATRSLAHGTCTHGTGNVFSCSFLWFRFDPATGAPVGMQRVRREMTLSGDRTSFTATDTIDVLAPDGTLVASTQGTEVGHILN